MKKIFFCMLVMITVLYMCSRAEAGTLYTINANTLYGIDTNTNAISSIGGLGVTFSFGGLAYNSKTDTLYMVDGQNASENLYTVDQGTGKASLVGNHGQSSLFGLAYDVKNDVLYGGQFTDGNNLVSLNTTDGSATTIGPTAITNLGGLAYDSKRDHLIGVADGLGDLYEIDRTLATSTLLFNGPGQINSGLAYDIDKDVFYDIDFTGNVFQYDPTNAYARSTIQTLSLSEWDGAAYKSDIQPVPEPATIALLGIGLVGLAGSEVRRRRKKKTVDNS